MKKKLGLLLKVLLSAFLLYLVFSKLEYQKIKSIYQNANKVYLVVSVLLYALSQVISSFRLNTLLKKTGVLLSQIENLKLYSLGLFYNMFIPGGIGGDAYKIFLLNRSFKTPVKKLTATLFYDRLNGLSALGLYFLLFTSISKLPEELSFLKTPAIIGCLLVPLLAFVLTKRFFKDLSPVFIATSIKSLFIQGIQLVCVTLFCLAIGIEQGILFYLILFLLSSVLSVLPISIGGIGVRELTFVYGAKYLDLDSELAFMIGLLFFVTSALISLSGVYFNIKGIDLSNKKA